MFEEYKPAILFLVKYFVLYLVLNTLYAFYIDHYAPSSDPATIATSRQVAILLEWLGEPVHAIVEEGSSRVLLMREGTTIIRVYEGCNSLNVMIVYVAFLIAFRGPLKATLWYVGVGLAAIYVMNLLRVLALYGVALHYPDKLYFFHKFFFTGVIYMVVFILWFFWFRRVKKWRSETT